MKSGPSINPRDGSRRVLVEFDRGALRHALRSTGTTIAVLDEAMRMNGKAVSVYSHLDGERWPSGEVVALYAALLGLAPGQLYRVKLAATLAQAKRSLLKRRSRGRPRKAKAAL